MRYGFTGSRHCSPEAKVTVVETLKSLAPGERYTTGACVGVDAFVGQMMLRLHPEAEHRVIVPSDRSRVDYWWTSRHLDGSTVAVAVEMMSPGTTYRDRNARIVACSDMLVAFPEHEEDDQRSQWSGTWQTVRMARSAGLAVVVVVLAGSWPAERSAERPF